MTNRNILDAFGGISLDLIEEAVPRRGQKERNRKAWVKWGAVAASGLILVLAFLTSIKVTSLYSAMYFSYISLFSQMTHTAPFSIALSTL